jgi:tight adherence protein B
VTVVVSTIGALGLLLLYDGLTRASGPGSASWARRLDQLAAESDTTGLNGTRLMMLSLAGAVVAGMLVAGITSSLVVSLVFFLGGAALPVALLRSRRNRRRRRFREAWPDALAVLVSGIRAGISLPEACVSLGERGPEQLQPSFKAFSSSYRATGSFEAGLDRLRQSLADPIADRVIAALALAHQVGGTDLVRVLRTLSDFVAEDLRTRKEIEARWSWTVTAARVAAAAPWIVLLLMSTKPEASTAYSSSSGIAAIVAGAVATIVGYRLMLRAAQLPDERRLQS